MTKKNRPKSIEQFNSTTSLSVDTYANQSIKNQQVINNNRKTLPTNISNKSLIKKEINDEKTSTIELESLTFKLPNLKNDPPRTIEHTNFKASLNSREDHEIGIWPVPMLTHSTRMSHRIETNNSDDDEDDGEECDEDDEEFPKTLESLLLKQWNLGLELFNQNGSSSCNGNSSKSESFEIIKLLNLLSECKKENRDLEKSLASLEKKKARLESLNSKLSIKFNFNSSEENNGKNEKPNNNTYHMLNNHEPPSTPAPPSTLSTPASGVAATNHSVQFELKTHNQLKSQSPVSFSNVPPRPSSSVSFHNPVSSAFFQANATSSSSQPVNNSTTSSIINTPTKKTSQHQQAPISSSSSFSQNNFIMASPISSASSQNSSMNNSFVQQLTPNLNRPHSQPHPQHQHQTNSGMHNNNNNNTNNSNNINNNSNSTSNFLNNYLQNLNQNLTASSNETRGLNASSAPQSSQHFLSLLSKSLTSSMVNNPAFANSLLNMNTNNSNNNNSNINNNQQNVQSPSNPYSSSLLQAFQNPLNYQQIAYYLASNSNLQSSNSSSSSSNVDPSSSSILTNVNIIKSPNK